MRTTKCCVLRAGLRSEDMALKYLLQRTLDWVKKKQNKATERRNNFAKLTKLYLDKNYIFSFNYMISGQN